MKNTLHRPSPAARVFYISLVFLNGCRVSSVWYTAWAFLFVKPSVKFCTLCNRRNNWIVHCLESTRFFKNCRARILFKTHHTRDRSIASESAGINLFSANQCHYLNQLKKTWISTDLDIWLSLRPEPNKSQRGNHCKTQATQYNS